jgi:hypothetical protein
VLAQQVVRQFLCENGFAHTRLTGQQHGVGKAVLPVGRRQAIHERFKPWVFFYHLIHLLIKYL